MVACEVFTEAEDFQYELAVGLLGLKLDLVGLVDFSQNILNDLVSPLFMNKKYILFCHKCNELF